MSSLSHLKGVRTRFRNILLTEIQIGVGIMSTEVKPPEEQQFVLKASKCAGKKCIVCGKIRTPKW